MRSFTCKTLLIEVDEGIVTITINRPEVLNAFNPQVMPELNEVLDQAQTDDSIKVLVISGAGEKAFVVGNDLPQLAALDSVGAYEQMIAGQSTLLRIHEYPKPVIAMVNGYALGGGFELALSCDMIVASDNAKFGFPEINLNTMPGWGGTQMAAKKLGLNRAKEMIFTGSYYPAESCREFGFINRITTPERLREVTMELATTLAAKQSFSLKMAKDAVNRGVELDFATGFRFEAQAYTVNFSAPHAKAGFEAFLNRKKDK
jgi:enoyl-CoA hydratase/carnithine racemase